MPSIAEYFPGVKGGLVTFDGIDIGDLGDIKDANGNDMLEFDTATSAVNYFRLLNAATSANPVFSAQGSDTNVGLSIAAKGTGAILAQSNLTVDTSKTLAVTTADLLTVGGVIVPQAIEVTAHVGAAALMVDQTFFLANAAYTVTRIQAVYAVAESTAGSLKLQVTKDTSTNAPGAGTDLLTNNANTGFDCKATANTVQTGTLTATSASLALAAGDRLSLDFEAGATELVGLTVTVSLKRV